MNEAAKEPEPKLRWYQYSLRSLLIFMLVAGVFLGWIGKEIQEAERVKAMMTSQISREVMLFLYMDSLASVVKQYKNETGTYPQSVGLNGELTYSPPITNLRQQYKQFKYVRTENGFRIESAGLDDIWNTEDDLQLEY